MTSRRAGARRRGSRAAPRFGPRPRQTHLALIGILTYAVLVPAYFARAQTGASLRGNSPDPVAIVEEISPGIAGLQRFDLLPAGRAAELGAGGRLVLGYLKSCWQDSIAGGRAVVEPLKSLIENGALSRRRVECDAAGLARMTSEVATRGGSSLPGAALPEADINLYGLSPIILAKEAGALSIERLDVSAPALKIELAENRVDLREKGIALAAKGLYRFTRGAAAIVVRIDNLAEAGSSPAVGRLVIFR